MVKLIQHMDISPFGSENMLVGDINADGRAEFVFSQGPGTLGTELFKPGKAEGWRKDHVTDEDIALNCLTAMDLDGQVIWQTGEPWQCPYPFRTHGRWRGMMLADIDGDGCNELWRIHRGRLEEIDGKTGRVRRSLTLDSDVYFQIFAARFTNGHEMQVVIKPAGAGLEGHPHGCPVIAYDHELNPFWTPHNFKGVGHNPLPLDVNGDGQDELLIGWELVYADASVGWTLPLVGEADKGHPDRRIVMDIDDDGELEQVLALEALGLIVSDLHGNVKRTKPSQHCGGACVGKFFGDRHGLQIMYNDEVAGQKKNDGTLTMVDGRDGTIIWEHNEDLYGDTIDWPTELGPQAILAWRHEYYDDPEDSRPFIMDGNRRIIATFDIPRRLPSRKDFDLPHSYQWRGDWGDYYEYRYVDLDGSGQRIVISSRKDLWIFDADVES